MSVETLGWALIHSLWQGALIAAIVTPVLALTRQSAAAVRYAVCLVGLGLMVVAPLATALRVAPSFREFIPLGAAIERAPVARLTSNEISQGNAGGDVARGSRSPGIAANDVSLLQVEAGPSGIVRSIRARLENALPLLVGVWLAGVALLSLRLVGGLRVTRRLTTSGTSAVGRAPASHRDPARDVERAHPAAAGAHPGARDRPHPAL